MDHLIEVENVTMRFGSVEVLRGVSCRVEQAKTICILGGSGGGKSTLLKIMFGALRPTSGRVLIDGQDICCLARSEMDKVRQKFGVMFQGSALLNSLTVGDNVALPLRYHSQLDEDTIETIVKMKLQQVDLLHARQQLPAKLSGGMQKRAAVARALALDPKILFYDEPSAGLDPITTTRIDQLINKLRDGMNMTNVVVTHVMESVARIADYVLMLDQGKVILDGTLDDLMNSEDGKIKQFRTGELGRSDQGQTSMADYVRDLLM